LLTRSLPFLQFVYYIRKKAKRTDTNRKKEPKTYWRDVRGWKGERSTLPRVLRWEGGEAITDEELQEAWAAAFEDLGQMSHDPSFDGAWKEKVEGDVKAMEQDRWHQAELDANPTLREVTEVLTKLTNGKAPGTDGIFPEMLKYGGLAMTRSVVALFGTLWETERVPTEWKLGAIFPLYKKGDPHNTGNYRGITLLSVIGKALEAIVNARLTAYCESNLLIRDEQGGFRAKRGCLDLIFMLSEIINSRSYKKPPAHPPLHEINNNKNMQGKIGTSGTYLCFIDVKKAYDTVWQNGLWWKLWEKGIRGKTWRFVKEWYRDMRSHVLVDGEATRDFRIHQGVKQGCILSPLLYSLFVNDAARELEAAGLGVRYKGRWCGIMLYADDIVLLANDGAELQKMIDILVKFSQKWRYHMHPEKSEVMVIGVAPKKRTWTLNGKAMKTVTSFKYLGVDIQRNGNWNELFKRLIRRAHHRTDMLVGMGMRAHVYSVETAAHLWHSLVAPLLEYGAAICEPTSKYIESVETEQLRAARTILGCQAKTAAAGVRGELGWLSMKARRTVHKLRYFRHLATMDNTRIVHHVFRTRYNETIQGTAHGWCGELRELLKTHGLGEWWRAHNWGGFPSKWKWDQLVSAAVHAREEDNWIDTMYTKPSLTWYRTHNTSLALANYLKGDVWGNSGTVLRTQLRCGMHDLRVCTGLRERPRVEDRGMRTCLVCKRNAIEDVPHFLLDCVALESARKRMWDRIHAWYKLKDNDGLAAVMSLPPSFRVTFLLGGNAGIRTHPAVDRIAQAGVLGMDQLRRAKLGGLP
jgi:hypothetical protein